MTNWRKRLGRVGAAMAAMLSGAVFAQTPESGDDAETTHATPAMWRVADADSEFILLGTFHILPPDIRWRTDAFETALANAERVYFEVEADAPDAQSTAVGVVMTQGFNPPGETLTDMLDESDAQKLREITASLGLPFAGVDPMRPWNAFLTLTVQFIVNEGFQPGAGVDSVLLAEARTLGKDLAFFETLEEQLALFTNLDPETEKNLLVITLRDWDSQAQAFSALFDAWAAGDADFIDAQMNETMREQAPEVYERLIVERNKAWAETLDADLKNDAGNALVAVGAGHLVGGEHSVPGLLRAKGYEVSRYGDGDEIEDAAAADDTAETPQDEAGANDNAAPETDGEIDGGGLTP